MGRDRGDSGSLQVHYVDGGSAEVLDVMAHTDPLVCEGTDGYCCCSGHGAVIGGRRAQAGWWCAANSVTAGICAERNRHVHLLKKT